MISICHNSDCANMGTLRCSGCQTVFYCGVACAKSFWKFHKRVCQLRLENVPLPQRYLIPVVNSFPLQCFHVLDALDRSLRIVPPERDYSIHRNTRRALTHRFPFGVFFHLKDDSIVVVAVLHGSRDPHHWKQRT